MINYVVVLKSLCLKIRFLNPDFKCRFPVARLLLINITLLFISCSCISCTPFRSRQRIDVEKASFPLNADIIITDNTIYQNNRSGMQIRGNRPVRISSCSVYQNGRGGINIENSANVLIESSNLYQNGTSGVVADNASQIVVKNSLLHQNHRAGMRVRKDETTLQDSTLISLINNKIYLNERGGVHAIANGPTPLEILVFENAIYRNQEAGIRIEDNVFMTATKNEFYRNGAAGIATYITANQSPTFDVYQNKIYFNRGAGIFVHSGITGSIGISNNWIYNNQLAGIACGLWDGPEEERVDVEIFHNTIVGNGSDDIGAGIRKYGSENVLIKNNIIAYNFAAGIITDDCGGYSYNLLYANAKTSNVKAASKIQSIFIEREQYAGCLGRQRGDMLAVPLFVNPDQYDFSLQANSPARNTADAIDSSYFNLLPNNNLGADPLLLPTGSPWQP